MHCFGECRLGLGLGRKSLYYKLANLVLQALYLVLQASKIWSNSKITFRCSCRLLVKGDRWMTWSQDTTSIPIYILEGLHNTKALANTNNENAWMELTEENFRAGDNLPLDPSMVVSALRLLLRLIALARTQTRQSSALLKSNSEV